MPVSRQSTGDGIKPAKNRRGVFRLRRVFGGLLILFLLLLSAAVLLHRTLIRAYAPTILNTLATEFEYFYDLDLTWDGYRISGLDDFTITGISITDIPSNMTLLQIDSIRVRTSLFALAIRGQDPIRGVTSVELDHPSISLGREGGRWNTGKILEPGDGETYQFPGRLGIVIRDGIIEWKGGEFADGFPFPPSQIAGLQGNFRLGTNGGMGMRLEGIFSGSEAEPTPVIFKGTYDPERFLMQLGIEASSLDIKFAKPLLNEYEIQGSSGLVDTSVSILIGPDAGDLGYSILGNALLTDGAVSSDLYGFSANDLNGDLNFSHESIFTSGLAGNINGAPLNIYGYIGDFANEVPSTSLIIESKDLPVSAIKEFVPDIENIPMSGSINVRAEVSTSTEGITAVLSADSPALSILATPLSITEFFAWYAEGKIVIPQIEMRLFDGAIIADGGIDLTADEPSYEFQISASNLPVDKLSAYLPIRPASGTAPSGMVSANLAISGKGLEFPDISGLITAEKIKIPALPGLPAAKITIPLQSSGSDINIREATAVTDGAVILAEGVYRHGSGFDGTLAVTVDDPGLVNRAFDIPASGIFIAAGDLSYSPAEGIGYDGDVVISDARFGSVDAPNLSCRVALEGAEFRISDLSGLINGGEIEGEIAFPISPAVNGGPAGTFNVRGFNVGQIFPPEISRAISTTLDITGDFSFEPVERGLKIDMTICEDSAQFGPNSLTTDEEGISVIVDYPLYDSGQPSLVVSGKLNSRQVASPVYQGRVLTPYASRVVSEVTDLLTERIREGQDTEMPALPTISGAFDVQADIRDLFADTQGSLDITTGNFDISGVEFSSAGLHLEGREGNTWDVDFRLDAFDAGSFEVTGSIERGETLAMSTLALSAAVHNSGLNTLFGFVGLAEFGRTSGSINGSGLIQGMLSNPVVENFQLEFGESEVFGIQLSEGMANFSLEAPMLNFTSLEIQGSDGFRALGAGAVDLTSVSLTGANLVFRLDDFNIAELSKGLGKELPVAGIISGTVQLAQDALGPRILYDAEVNDLAYITDDAPLSLGNLAFSAETRPGDPQINIKQLELNRNGETIKLSGLIPSSDDDFGAELFDLVLESETGYSIPPPEIPGNQIVGWDGGLGPVHLALMGSIAFPVLTGEINVGIRDITFYDASLIQNIEGILDIENSVIRSSPESFKMTGDGWEIGFEGFCDLNKLKLFYLSYIEDIGHIANMGTIASVAVVQPSADAIKLSGKGFDLMLQCGTGEKIPKLEILSSREKLIYSITGDILITSGHINLADLPEFPVSQPDIEREDSALSFDLHSGLLEGFRIQNGNSFNIVCKQADLNLSGNLNYPVITGSLSAPDGWMDLFGNHFILIEPLEMRLSWLYPLTDPYIKATVRKTFREVRSPTFYGEELVVTARIDSRMSTMIDDMIQNNRLTSEPPLGQDQLIAALAYEDFVFRAIGNTLLGDSTMDPGFDNIDLTGMVLPFATSYLSKYIRREAGFTDFEISMDQDQNLLIYIEKEVFDNMVMYYMQKFGPDAEDNYLWGARYRWRPRSWVGFEVDSDEEITPQVEYIIPIN